MRFERPESQKMRVDNGTQPAFTCSKGTVVMSEQYVKSVQS